MQTLIAKIAAWVLPVLLGPLVYLLSRKLLNVHAYVDALPPTTKRIVVAVLGVLVANGFAALGVAAPAECLPNAAGDCLAALATTPVLQGLAAAAVAMVCHALKKAPPRA